MQIRSFLTVLVESAFLTGLVALSLVVSFAEVRSSTNYALESDSINFAGGLSTSSSYMLESTAGEIASGDSESASYQLRAGYQQMQAVFISITTPDPVVMSPALGGITGGTANGSTSVTVLTDSPSGYELTIATESAPALRFGAETIPDYVPVSTPNPDFIFTTGTTEAFFGFSPEGTDIAAAFKDNGVACNAGSSDTENACWQGLSTVERVIANGSANQPSGTETKLKFRVELGSETTVLAGEYVATTTLTALPL